VLHIVIFWVNSLGVPFEKKYFLLKAVPAICSKSWAKLSSSTGWMICLEMVPAQVWNCVRGWDLVPLASCNLFLLLLKTFLLSSTEFNAFFCLFVCCWFFFCLFVCFKWQLHTALEEIFIINSTGFGEHLVIVEGTDRGERCCGTMCIASVPNAAVTCSGVVSPEHSCSHLLATKLCHFFPLYNARDKLVVVTLSYVDRWMPSLLITC